MISCVFNLTNSKSLKSTEAPAAEAVEPSKILFEGWVKYFHFETNNVITKPTQFFVNHAYHNQKVLLENFNDKDDKG